MYSDYFHWLPVQYQLGRPSSLDLTAYSLRRKCSLNIRVLPRRNTSVVVDSLAPRSLMRRSSSFTPDLAETKFHNDIIPACRKLQYLCLGGLTYEGAYSRGVPRTQQKLLAGHRPEPADSRTASMNRSGEQLMNFESSGSGFGRTQREGRADCSVARNSG